MCVYVSVCVVSVTHSLIRSFSCRHGHKGTVVRVKWNQNGHWLATAGRDQLVKLIDLRYARRVRECECESGSPSVCVCDSQLTLQSDERSANVQGSPKGRASVVCVCVCVCVCARATMHPLSFITSLSHSLPLPHSLTHAPSFRLTYSLARSLTHSMLTYSRRSRLLHGTRITKLFSRPEGLTELCFIG